jgi:DNA-binding MarR family transcriptional regulator
MRCMSREPQAPEPQSLDPHTLELSLAAQFAAWAMLDEVSARLAADGYDDTRFSDGVVFQHLVDGPRSVTDLAGRMGVTQQAASKAAADLERRGYVSRRRDPGDGRAKQVALTKRGTAIVRAARRHRAAVDAEVAERLGPRRVGSAQRTLLDVVRLFGAETALRSRRVRPPV